MKRMKEPFHTLLWKASIGYADPFIHMDIEVLERYSELLREHFRNEGFQLGLEAAAEAKQILKDCGIT